MSAPFFFAAWTASVDQMWASWLEDDALGSDTNPFRKGGWGDFSPPQFETSLASLSAEGPE